MQQHPITLRPEETSVGLYGLTGSRSATEKAGTISGVLKDPSLRLKALQASLQ